MAEPIEMLFGLRTLVGPGNHVLDGVQIPQRKRAILRGKGASRCKVWGPSAVICAKTAEPIEMPFRLWARMGPRNHTLEGGSDSHKKGQFLGKVVPTVKYGDTLRSPV